VSSMRFAPAYAEAFHQPLELFDASIGIPRTDILLGPGRDAIAQTVLERYPAIAGKRVVLYAPTFRGDSAIVAREPLGLDLRMLQEQIGHDHVVLLRQHPFVRGANPT